MKPLKEGEVAYIRVRIVKRTGDKGFGDYEVQPVTKHRTPTTSGRYLYVDRDELVTVEEAKGLVR